MRRKTIYFILFLVLFLLDRVAKLLALENLSITRNTGTLFGLFTGNNIPFIILSILILLLLLYSLSQFDLRKRSYIIIIISGIFSNLFDRILYGYIIDFIDLTFWPVFNLADVFITLGVTFLILDLLGK